MTDAPTYVVSDIHLGIQPEVEPRFRRFLRHVATEGAAKLVINGDLFDFWFEYRSVIPAQHFRVLAALADVRDAGIPISFVGGNHDAWGGRFLRDDVGLDILPDAAEIDLAGNRCLIVHGDGVGVGDLGYRVLKKIIRHPISIGSFRLLHPDWGNRLASLVSTTDEKAGNAHGANRERAAALSKWAQDQLAQRADLDLVLAGHTHTPEVTEYFPGRFYVNTGDWINHFTYLTLEPGRPPELSYWETEK